MIQIVRPFDRRLIRELPLSTPEEAASMLDRAFALFSDRRQWLPVHQRVAILDKVAMEIASRIEEFTVLAAEEGGKPYIDSKAEVQRAVSGIRIAVDCMNNMAGEQIPMGLNIASSQRLAFTLREPAGVVFSISAFNHPLNLIVHQTVTAIAAGCPVIIKPSLRTPLSCLAFVKLLHEAGLPQGWCEVLLCTDELAESIAADARVAYLSFIGSAKVGWHLRSRLAPGTRCGLEHGGAAPVIVEKDADLAATIPALLKGGFYHAGQVCVSVQRIFVHESICEQVTDELAKGARALIVGDPLSKDTEVGPLITQKEVDRVHDWVTEAVAGSARLLCGGKRISDTCYEPTVLFDPPPSARVSTLEVFGPVVCVYPFEQREAALKAANSLDLHFQAAVFTTNMDTALECAMALNATGVMVNDHTAFRVDWMPFGGRDVSGLGLGGIPYSIREMTREKMVVFKSRAL